MVMYFRDGLGQPRPSSFWDPFVPSSRSSHGFATQVTLSPTNTPKGCTGVNAVPICAGRGRGKEVGEVRMGGFLQG